MTLSNITIVMRVIMLCIVMLSANRTNVVVLGVILFSVVMLSVITHNNFNMKIRCTIINYHTMKITKGVLKYLLTIIL